MQMTDRRHDGQAEPVTGQTAAPIETVETRDDLRSLLESDARTFVPNHDRHDLSVFSRSDSHGRRGAAAVLERVVDRLAVALARRSLSPSVVGSPATSTAIVTPLASAVASYSSTTSMMTSFSATGWKHWRRVADSASVICRSLSKTTISSSMP